MSDTPGPEDRDQGAFEEFFSASEGEQDPNFSLAFEEEVSEEEVARVLGRALGDVPLYCQHCGELCPDHVIRVRDALFARCLELTTRLSQLFSVYRLERELEISEPTELIQKIYETWGELQILYTQTEPQNEVSGEGPDEEA